MKKRVGILTSGGDCPGLNATIRGVAKALYARMGDNVEIVGILNGYSGLINGDYKEMSEDDFRGILTLGGTILGTKRTPFKMMRVVEDDNVDKVAAMKKTYKDAKLDCLLCLGGNGTHKTANLLSQEGLNIIGMKGFDLVQSIADGLVDRGIELVILGSGESQYESFFSDLCARHPGRVGTYIGFEPALSQEIYAGADAFIMPSKSEPCGLAQMVACRYGTPPIVRETGGLRDSIHDSTMGDGNGFTFAGYSAHELYEACCHAQDAYNNKENWHNLVHHCMECDFSWDVSAKSYEGLYNETANLW